jgi:ankyrin repeat protein
LIYGILTIYMFSDNYLTNYAISFWDVKSTIIFASTSKYNRGIINGIAHYQALAKCFPKPTFGKICGIGYLDTVKWYLRSYPSTDIHYFDEWALILATRYDHRDVIKHLLDLGANINIGYINALGTAALAGNLKLVTYFIEHYSPTYISCEDAFILGASNGHLEVVQLFIQRGVNMNCQYGKAICECSKRGHLNLVKYFLSRGASIVRILESSAETGQLEIIQYLMINNMGSKADYDSALQKAALHGKFELVQYLVHNGIDINDNALITSIKGCHVDIFWFLIESGANIRTQNDIILLISASHGCLDIVHYMVDIGANVNTSNPNMYPSKSALSAAASNGHLHIMQYLVEKGANCTQHLDEAMEKGAYNGYFTVIDYLVKLGVTQHAKNQALHMAASNNSLDIVRYLVTNGADVNYNYGMPLHRAVENGYLDIVQYLVENGADIHANSDIFSDGILFGYVDVTKYLESKGATFDDEVYYLCYSNSYSNPDRITSMMEYLESKNICYEINYDY